jgi:hypothetical protein
VLKTDLGLTTVFDARNVHKDGQHITWECKYCKQKKKLFLYSAFQSFGVSASSSATV